MKKTLTLIAVMLAIPVFAALQMVDISTLTTNTVIHVVSPGILFTNFSTNAYTRYTTTDTNALQIGDTPYQAFTKVNANFTLLAFTTNAITSLLPTNALVPSVSGNTGFIPTNSAGGGSGTTNFTLTGFVQNWTTNNQLSTAGTNTVSLLITNLAIASQNGFGTNTTLISGVSVTTTNLSVIGDTWLNNSNVTVFGTLSTLSTNISTNYIIIAASLGFGVEPTYESFLLNTNYQSFTNATGNGDSVFYTGTNWEVTGSSGSLQFTPPAFTTNTSYPPAFTFGGTYGAVSYILYNSSGMISNSPVYWPCYLYIAAYRIFSTNVTGAASINVISNSIALEILSTNDGVTINTNANPGGYALNTHGGINVDDNYYINGVPISQSIPALPPGLLVLSATNSRGGNYTNLNGLFYLQNPNTYTFTNSHSARINAGGIYDGTNVNNTYYLFWAANPLNPLTNYVSYAGSTLIGYYFANDVTNPTNTAAVSYVSGQMPFSPTNYLQAGAGGNTDGSLLTGLNLTYRAGITNIPTLTTSQAVLFSTPFSPTVGTNYSVSVSFDTALAAAVGFSTTSKTTNGFTVTLSGTITGAVQVDYAAWPYQ